MLGGYAVLLLTPLLYTFTWWVRHRRLGRDLEMLQTLKSEEPDRKSG
jgi:hypothetical protein